MRIEQSVLSEIIDLHPDHLSQDELILRMEDCPVGTDRLAILDSLQALKRSGLIRLNGEVVEPTFAALRAAAIFDCP